MTADQMRRQYGIPADLLEAYEGWREENEEERQYEDRDLERLSLMMTLSRIGMDQREIGNYLTLAETEDVTGEKRLSLLERRREALLEEIHIREQELAELDFLRYEIKKGM